jgi:subtilase family serine protease
MGFYLSTDNVFSSNDVSLGSQTATTLSGGGYLSRFATITVATSTTAGTYYVLFVADPLNLVTETSETNNVTSISRAATPLLVLSQGSFSNKNEGLSLPLHGKTTHTIRFDVG